jgi:hypothetical protein
VLARRRGGHHRPAASAEVERERPARERVCTDTADDVQPPPEDGRAPCGPGLGEARKLAPPGAVELERRSQPLARAEEPAVPTGDVEVPAAPGDEGVVHGDRKIRKATPAPGQRLERVHP